MNETKTIKFQLNEGQRLTGRQISPKLVISKNKNSKGNNVTLVFWLNKKNWDYYFVPISDIYLDVNKNELIMPKLRPVPVARALYSDIIPSKKYCGFNVFAPDSDFEPIFKEIEKSDGKRFWCLAFDEIVLHYYDYNYCLIPSDWWRFWPIESLYDDIKPSWSFDMEDYCSAFLSTHQIFAYEKLEQKHISEQDKIAKDLMNGLYEEAGWDFMDVT